VAVRASVAPLQGEHGEEDGNVVLLRDTTHELEVERMKTEFLSNVSHELRTPLTPIRGFAELLRRRPETSPEQVAEFAGTIVDATVRLGRVVDLLVAVAALEANRVQPSPRPLAVGAYVDELLDDWRGRWPHRSGDLRRRVASGLPAVAVDPEWISRAMAELADNAMKYTQPGTPVTLVAALSADGQRVRLGVRDGGPGVTAEQLPSLLGDFAQGDGSATRAVGGLGLGLSFVRRLAEDFALPFVVTSEPGKGAEFALDLPVTTERPRRGQRGASVPPRRRQPAGARRRRIPPRGASE
jgi:signal transduction histidine kinase